MAHYSTVTSLKILFIIIIIYGTHSQHHRQCTGTGPGYQLGTLSLPGVSAIAEATLL